MRIDKTILQSFFNDRFKEDLWYFVHKYHVDKNYLGPWFTSKAFDQKTSDPSLENKYINQQVKQIKRNISKREVQVSPSTRRVLE